MDIVNIINNPKEFPFYKVVSRSNLYIDKNIIPKDFYTSVIQKNRIELINNIKYNPKLSKKVLAFYQLNLNASLVYKKAGKISGTTKVPWNVEPLNTLYLSSNEQVNYYLYITKIPWYNSNYGFMFNTIRNYLSQLAYARSLLFQGINITKYYPLGINVTNDKQFLVFIAQFV
tara:strand:+ start:1642 stop:2160 length:519 start_codon:yes stop_codon:yes gene_type:complete